MYIYIYFKDILWLTTHIIVAAAVQFVKDSKSDKLQRSCCDCCSAKLMYLLDASVRLFVKTLLSCLAAWALGLRKERLFGQFFPLLLCPWQFHN